MLKALIVDDSSTQRQAVRNTLQEMKFKVTEAKNGAEAFDVLDADKNFDLIICDVHMPVMSGIEFSEKMFKKGLTEKIPVLMLTSESNEDIKRQGKEYKVKGWIIKPVNAESLKAIVKKVLNIT